MTDLFIFLTFAFLYTVYRGGDTGALTILLNSLFKRFAGNNAVTSPAVFLLMLFTWLIMATLSLSAESLHRRYAPGIGWWLRGFGVHAIIVWGGWLVYGLIQASVGRREPQAPR